MRSLGALALALAVAAPGFVIAEETPAPLPALPPEVAETVEGVTEAVLDWVPAIEPGEPPILPEPDPIPDVRQYIPRPLAWATITSDLAGAEVSGPYELTGTATAEDGFKVRRVGILVDNAFVGFATDTSEAGDRSTWSFLLDTGRLVDGDHQVKALAYTHPAALDLPGAGWGERVAFRALNAARGEVLFEDAFTVSGAHHQEIQVPIPKDYATLRVFLDVKPLTEEAQAKPRALLELAYQKSSEMGEYPSPYPSQPDRTWVATYGEYETVVVISRDPDAHLEAPGLLALVAEYAGDAEVTLRLEAIPLEAP